jgi:NAD(P)-dependent dehydrogenase (short-subunit alcohol dehydrogenase family)
VLDSEGNSVEAQIREHGGAATYVHLDVTKEADWSDPKRKQRTEQTTPLGRYGQSIDVAYGVLYLASNEASFVTGSELVVDGGVTAK